MVRGPSEGGLTLGVMEVDPVASSNDKTREGGLVLDTTGGLATM